jgi:uncharacterized protein YbbC (DUF1343 family)
VSQLNAQKLPGLNFEPARYKTRATEGKVTSIHLAGREFDGLRIVITDHKTAAPLEAGVTILQLLRDHARLKAQGELIDQENWLGYLAGTKRLYEQLRRGKSANDIIASWKDEVEKFKAARTPYLLYK